MQIKDIQDNYTRDLALFEAKKDRERWGLGTKIDTLMDLYLESAFDWTKTEQGGVFWGKDTNMVKNQYDGSTLLIKDIKNDHARSLAIKRAKESESRNGSHVEESTIMKHILCLSFDWDKTPRGYRFWDNVNKNNPEEYIDPDETTKYIKTSGSHRDTNVGKSNYSDFKIQVWDIWKDYNLNPFDADIVKRVLRTKEGDSRIMDYKKIIHVCQERINQLEQE